MRSYIPADFTFPNYLPAGARVIAHFMPWFGGKDHIDVGYKSDDAGTIEHQLDKMQALGVDSICVEYYGHRFAANKPWYTRATLRMFAACEKRGLGFCVCPSSAFMDAMLPKADQTDTNKTTSAVVELLDYCASTFFPSEAYLDDAGRPLVMWFGTEQFPIAWDNVRNAASRMGNPKFLFRNASGFGKAQSDGAFAWPAPWTLDPAKPPVDPNDPNLGPQLDFWKAAAANPTKVAVGAIYTGFSDELSTWGPVDAKGARIPRRINRRNGLTLLETLSIVPASAKYLQICTWNDREEGSDIERNLGDI